MADKTHYICTGCDHRELRWLGKCPSCGAWNTLEARTTAAKGAPAPGRRGRWPKNTTDTVTPVPMSEVDTSRQVRMPVEPRELSEVLGGGLVPGSLVLLGGVPGVGKSTLLTMLAAGLARDGRRVVYLSAEESGAQVRGRAERLGAVEERLYLLEEPALERVLPPLHDAPPTVLIVDSIQTVYSGALESTPGSVAQIKACGALLADFARSTGCVVVLVGHVTKDGDLAGPRVLEHLVDTVLYFEPEAGGAVRIIRAFKNRFGSTGELAIMEMGPSGLTPVKDASSLFLSGRRKGEPGSAVTAVVNGNRPFLVEVQALLQVSQYGTPARVVAGMDAKRVALLSAILERKGEVQLLGMDTYVKVAGGVRVTDPAADLAIVAALASSLKEKPLPSDVVLMAEVGLTGELRPVQQLNARLTEAYAHGFHRAVVASGHDQKGFEPPRGQQVERCGTVLDALRAAFRWAAEAS